MRINHKKQQSTYTLKYKHKNHTKMEIFGKPKTRYGNVWAFTSRMIRYGIRNHLDVVYISHKSKRIPQIQEMWDCFDNHGIRLEVTSKRITTKKKYGVGDHQELYIRTRTQWKQKKYNRVCYQFDSDSSRTGKFFKGNYQIIIDKIHQNGVEVVSLGLPFTLQECIDIAANSDVFMGICSGMSHMCHSVGVPMLLQSWSSLQLFHPNKIYNTFEDEKNLIRILTTMGLV